MASASQTSLATLDERFFYEPLLSAHPETLPSFKFLGFDFDFPLWISSMTGGAQHAESLNSTMAKLAGEFRLGMGLGSCRPMLEDEQSAKDFDVKHLIGERPLFANFGIAQIEKSLTDLTAIHRVVERLKAQGLIIHVNPLQEWYQSGGDRFKRSPLETIERFMAKASYPVIVKEVGHGMGPKSLKALMQLPLAAIEFASYGGTNFSLLEATRRERTPDLGLAHVGHSAQEMVGFVKEILAENDHILCKQFIISGGVKDSLQGYALVSQLPGQAVFGMAHSVLQMALQGEEKLRQYLQEQKAQYMLAQAYLTVRK